VIIPVPSSDGKSTYDVVFEEGGFRCPCKGFSFRQTCRHIPLAQAKPAFIRLTLGGVTIEKLTEISATLWGMLGTKIDVARSGDRAYLKFKTTYGQLQELMDKISGLLDVPLEVKVHDATD
jgi:hypothetical protein